MIPMILLFFFIPSVSWAGPIVVYEQDFSSGNHNSYSGHDGYLTGYSSDDWSIKDTDGVRAKTDDSGGSWGTNSAIDNHLVYEESWADYQLELTLQSGDNDALGAVFRYQDDKNFYLFFVTRGSYPGTGYGSDESGSGAFLYVIEAGFATQLDVSGVTDTEDDQHDLLIEVHGDLITISFDEDSDGISADDTLFSIVDSTFASGQFGFYCYNNGREDDDGCVFDDVTVSVPDDDDDGYSSEEDCDDTDGSVNPSATEICNGIDDNCDGLIDEDLSMDIWYPDDDGDGYGDDTIAIESCVELSGHADNDLDCDDGDPDISPNALEVCDHVDNDCDDLIDELDPSLNDFSSFYADDDGDGFGDPTIEIISCSATTGYVDDNSDCDDGDPAVYPDAPEVCDGIDNNCDAVVDNDPVDGDKIYPDSDEDGYGVSEDGLLSCSAKTGYVAADSDCDDDDATVNPGATEVCDLVDNDCDGTIDLGASDELSWYYDGDGDGYGDPAVEEGACWEQVGFVSDATDCDDDDAAVNPAATEICNSIDDDCDGDIDVGAVDPTVFYLDADGDGYGDPASTESSCGSISGYVDNDGDCDDGNASISPVASEYCNGIDDDCDTDIDEDAADATAYYADDDGDGFGDAADEVMSCSSVTGFVNDDSDCDDGDPSINPDALEVCDSLDNDCDSLIDNDPTDGMVYYADDDSDGFGDAGTSVVFCSAESGYVADDSDCDDSDPSINPDALETCDSVDNDCDSLIDNDPTDGTPYYADSDADGYGDPASTESSCSAPSGYVDNDGDCDDGVASINPGASEYCNGIDDDCDTDIDEDAVDATAYYLDSDGDGYGDAGKEVLSCSALSGYTVDATDCDDAEAQTHPEADEYCDGVDNDCDTSIDEDAIDATVWYGDSDGDGFGGEKVTVTECDQPSGYFEEIEDCDDGNASVHPGADEYCNGADDDCDGEIDEDAVDQTEQPLDADGDGYGHETESMIGCPDAEGSSDNRDDCDDEHAAIHPGAVEIAGNGIDEDCDGEDKFPDESEREWEPTLDDDQETTLSSNPECGCAVGGGFGGAPMMLLGLGLVLTRRRTLHAHRKV